MTTSTERDILQKVAHAMYLTRIFQITLSVLDESLVTQIPRIVAVAEQADEVASRPWHELGILC